MQRVPLQLLYLVSARRDVVSSIRGSISRAPQVMSEVAHRVQGKWIRGSISLAPRVMSEVAHQGQGRWIRDSINPGPRATAGVDDRNAGVNPIGHRWFAAAS